MSLSTISHILILIPLFITAGLVEPCKGRVIVLEGWLKRIARLVVVCRSARPTVAVFGGMQRFFGGMRQDDRMAMTIGYHTVLAGDGLWLVLVSPGRSWSLRGEQILPAVR